MTYPGPRGGEYMRPLARARTWEEIEQIMNDSFADEQELIEIWTKTINQFFVKDEKLKDAFDKAIDEVRAGE